MKKDACWRNNKRLFITLGKPQKYSVQHMLEQHKHILFTYVELMHADENMSALEMLSSQCPKFNWIKKTVRETVQNPSLSTKN